MDEAEHASNLSHLLNPKSIAVIGASEAGMYPAGVLQNLLAFQYKGKIFPVNPRRETVQGLRSYPKITNIKEQVDVAIVVIPRGFTIDIMEQCREQGVKGVIIVSSGFGESDEFGKEIQIQLEDFAKKTGIRVLGPNCAGLANIRNSVTMTLMYDNPATRPLLPGNVAFISQSGAMMMSTYGLFRDKEIGLSFIASTGNQADVEVSDLIEYAANDANTLIIATFVEGAKDGSKFVHALDAAGEKGKPVIMLKTGKTDNAKLAALTHTGSMVGSSAVYSAIFKQKHVVVVDDIDELVYTAKVFSTYVGKMPKSKGVAVFSQSGGLCSLAADWGGTLKLEFPELTGDTKDQLLSMDHLLTFGILRNPIDVRGAGTAPDTIESTLQPVLQDDKFGVVVIVLGRPVIRDRDGEVARAIIKVKENSDKPILVSWIGRMIPEPKQDIETCAHRILEKGGVPVFYNMRDTLKAAKHLIDYTQLECVS